jgi:hypothetical protein
MKDGASKSFEQAYNAQAAVDAEAQVIVGSSITQETNDKKQLVPMLEKVQEQTGQMPAQVSADAGYFSEAAVSDESVKSADLYVPPERKKRSNSDENVASSVSPECKDHSTADEKALDSAPTNPTQAEAMREKLKSPEGRAVYAQRKHVVEPVFGQIKEVRGFRRFSFRGLDKVAAEWDLICLTHNLLKLFRSGFAFQDA